MPDYAPAKLQSPGTAERLFPWEREERRTRDLERRFGKAAPKPAPATGWAKLSDLGKGIERLKGR